MILEIRILALTFLLFLNVVQIGFSQKKIPDFFDLSIHEKIWVFGHPFIARKAWQITKYAQNLTDSVQKDTLLDGNISGGQVDAFRHTFWMASLSQEIKWRKAYKLGIAHERKNKTNFKKMQYEDGSIPDAIASKMDLLNNKIGVDIGISNPNLDSKGIKFLVIEKIIHGELWIIKSDNRGNYLDKYNNVLNESDYIGSWENDKCIVKSDYISD